MGFIIDETPITRRILKIFEPTTLPTAISLEFLRAAFILTAVSGELVPKATIVSPTRIEGTLKILAMEDEPSTKKSAPLMSKTNPISKIKYSIIASPQVLISLRVIMSQKTKKKHRFFIKFVAL
jgi:hypothetical protein